AVADALAQRLEGVGIDAEEAARPEGFGKGAAGQEAVVAAEVEALKVGLVGRALQVEAGAPGRIEVPLAGREEMAADGVLSRILGPLAVVDAARQRQLAVGEALAVLTGGDLPGGGREDRREGGVAIGGDRPIIGQREMRAEIGAEPEARRQ